MDGHNPYGIHILRSRDCAFYTALIPPFYKLGYVCAVIGSKIEYKIKECLQECNILALLLHKSLPYNCLTQLVKGISPNLLCLGNILEHLKDPQCIALRIVHLPQHIHNLLYGNGRGHIKRITGNDVITALKKFPGHQITLLAFSHQYRNIPLCITGLQQLLHLARQQ